MNLSEIINILLGGSLLSAVVAIVTLRSTARRAKAEAAKAEADAETVRVDNAEHATRILVENIVKPLREELDATRKALEANKREMARLRKSIDTANSCKHRDDCPVLYGLRKYPEGTDGDLCGNSGAKGQHRKGGRNKDNPCGGSADADGDADPEYGQPP